MVSAAEHLGDLRDALARLEPSAAAVERHGRRIGQALAAGARLLAVGNGGSAAQAEHLTAERVGRFDGDRRPLAGIAIGAEYPSTTAIVNDYGAGGRVRPPGEGARTAGRRPRRAVDVRPQRQRAGGGGRRPGGRDDDARPDRPWAEPAGGRLP